MVKGGPRQSRSHGCRGKAGAPISPALGGLPREFEEPAVVHSYLGLFTLARKMYSHEERSFLNQTLTGVGLRAAFLWTFSSSLRLLSYCPSPTHPASFQLL